MITMGRVSKACDLMDLPKMTLVTSRPMKQAKDCQGGLAYDYTCR
jgi:hypothetical protein